MQVNLISFLPQFCITDVVHYDGHYLSILPWISEQHYNKVIYIKWESTAKQMIMYSTANETSKTVIGAHIMYDKK